jgi:hypothetical protein
MEKENNLLQRKKYIKILLARWEWCTPVIPVFKRLRQEDFKFEDSLDNIERPCLKKAKRKKKNDTISCK